MGDEFVVHGAGSARSATPGVDDAALGVAATLGHRRTVISVAE